MSEKVLVAYASKTGMTEGVAAAVGETLRSRGFEVDVRPMGQVSSLASYQRVVLGSAVNGANWMPEALSFVRTNQQALNSKPLAVFSVHGMNMNDNPRHEQNRRAYLKEVRPLLNAQEEGYFVGQGVDPKTAPAFLVWICRTFKFISVGDCRDWVKIRAWAEKIFA